MSPSIPDCYFHSYYYGVHLSTDSDSALRRTFLKSNLLFWFSNPTDDEHEHVHSPLIIFQITDEVEDRETLHCDLQ